MAYNRFRGSVCSGISGGANSPAVLIGGRSVQGIGGGGINLLIELIISDLVPLRERGNFLDIVFAGFALGTSIRPFVGGIIVQRTSWRWVRRPREELEDNY